MAKLLELAEGNQITVATTAAPTVFRDCHNNDISLRRYHYVNADPSDPSNLTTFGTTDPVGLHNALACYTADASIDELSNSCDDLVIDSSGDGYKISHPSFGDGTPGAMASAAYGDPARTTFKSLQDFARLVCQNGGFKDDLVANLDLDEINAIVLDQIEERVSLASSTAAPTPGVPNYTFVMAVQFDDSANRQFGE